jgi:hypothetical protein
MWFRRLVASIGLGKRRAPDLEQDRRDGFKLVVRVCPICRGSFDRHRERPVAAADSSRAGAEAELKTAFHERDWDRLCSIADWAAKGDSLECHWVWCSCTQGNVLLRIKFTEELWDLDYVQDWEILSPADVAHLDRLVTMDWFDL